MSKAPVPCVCASSSKRLSLPLRRKKSSVTSLEKLSSKLGKSEESNLSTEITSFLKLNGFLESLYNAPYVFELKVVHQPEQQSLKDGQRPPDDYYVNFGKAIETIKEDFPQLFVRDFDCESLDWFLRDDCTFCHR